MTPEPVGLGVHALSFAYADTPVLHDLDLEVPAGTVFALLGQSGSGKSTLLSILAGLQPPTRGRLVLGEEDITTRSPQDRRIGVVFQSYALFPHLSARDNIGFAPRQQGVPRDERDARVEEIAGDLGLAELLDRRPGELSGGQQQRVALARALAMRPRLLLLDEPLSNIDPALRARVRAQLRTWLRRWRVTTLLVTHDRDDAFWLADGLGLLRDGRLLQTGVPGDVYDHPVDLEAARLLGPADALPVARSKEGIHWAAEAATHLALVRPERVAFRPDGPGVPAHVVSCVDLGPAFRLVCRVGTHEVSATSTSPQPEGATGRLDLPPDPWLFPEATR